MSKINKNIYNFFFPHMSQSKDSDDRKLQCNYYKIDNVNILVVCKFHLLIEKCYFLVNYSFFTGFTEFHT